MTKKKKLGDLSKQDMITSLCVGLSERGYIPLLILIPDRAVHPDEFAQANYSIYGGIRDTALQIAIFREVADKIEQAMESGRVPETKPPLIQLV